MRPGVRANRGAATVVLGGRKREIHQKFALFELCLKSLLRLVFGQGDFFDVTPRHELLDHRSQ